MRKLLVVLVFALILTLPVDVAPTRNERGQRFRVQTTAPKLGVHTRLTDEVEEWKIARSLELVREMGASWIVEYFPWAYMQQSDGRHVDWQHADMVVDHALAQGLTVVARVDMVPAWARPADTTFRYLDEAHYNDYAEFIYRFVDHFRGRIHYVIIWNEPNLSSEWGERPVDAEAYVALLRLAYGSAKRADPSVQVVAAGLAPTLEPPGSQWGLNDLIYLQQMYDAGAAAYFDLLAAHAYGWSYPPDDPADPERVNFARIELLRDVMVQNGDGRKGMLVTEAGWNDHPRWTKAVRPAQRIAYTIRASEKVHEDWPWVQAIAFWNFRTPRRIGNYKDYFAFVNVDFSPRPIYQALQRYARGGEGE